MFVSPRPDHPQLPTIQLPRDRLLNQMQQSVQFPCTLISAPAGFGKTTLLLQWQSSTLFPVAWLSLQVEDNHVFHFASSLVVALQQVGILPSDFIVPMSAADPAFIHMFCTHVLSKMHRGTVDRAVVVLDDYHKITNSAIHQLVMYFIEHLPLSLVIVIATRTDPPFPLARWRTYGRLSEIRSSDLRFLAPEIHNFFRLRVGYQLKQTELTLLEERCEGWIASLQMVTLAQRERRMDMVSFLSKFRGTHHYVLDYVSEEVFAHLLPEQLSFLLATSVLDELCASLCNAVTGQNDGQMMLEQLEKANLFTIALDEERRWYRYHALFADVLRRRLEDTQSERLPSLHHRASCWYEEKNNLPKAIQHAFAGAHLERVVSILEQYGEHLLFAQGQGTTLIAWLDQLPLQLLRLDARICYVTAYAHLIQGRDDVERWIHYAETALPNIEDVLDRTYLQRQLSVLRFVFVSSVPTIEVRKIDEMAHMVLQDLPQHMVHEQSMIQFGLGKVYDYHGITQRAINAYSQAIEAGLSGNNHLMAQYALVRLAQLEEMHGRLAQSYQAYTKVIDLAQKYGEQYPATGVAVLGHILLLLEWNRLDEAAERCQMYVQRYITGPVSEELVQGLIIQAQIRYLQGEYEQANESVEHIKTLVETHHLPMGTETFLAFCVRLALQDGRYEDTEHWLATHPLEQVENMGVVSSFLIGTWLRVQIALKRCDVVHAYFHPMGEEKDYRQVPLSVVERLLFQALAFSGEGKNEDAGHYLAEAIRLAEPGVYICLFTAEGELIAPVLRQLIGQGSQHSVYIQTILQSVKGDRQKEIAVKRTTSNKKYSSKKHLLSNREMEILRLIAMGASNQDIGQQLTITLHTVKRHINNIFTKLAVTNRVQALNQAREQGWL